jgi:hypothetical protein
MRGTSSFCGAGVRRSQSAVRVEKTQNTGLQDGKRRFFSLWKAVCL